MNSLALHSSHTALGASFAEMAGVEYVAHYGNFSAEYEALRQHVGVADLSFRGRLCLVGSDRVRLLHGQVTNDVQKLGTGQGCYAALVSAKGKLEADLNIYALANELLLDFEPGLTSQLTERFQRYVVADDVEIVDAAPHYGMLSLQGPEAPRLIQALGNWAQYPAKPFAVASVTDAARGDLYFVNRSRCTWPLAPDAVPGVDLYVPSDAVSPVFEQLVAAAQTLGGRAVGWEALEACRIESGVPRYGVDLNETNLAPEAGEAFVAHAIHYAKGCYIGQEVIARIRTYGQVARALRGLVLGTADAPLPTPGDRLFHDGKDVGYVTSVLRSPRFGQHIALGLVRRECNQPGTELRLKSVGGERPARVVALPFAPAN